MIVEQKKIKKPWGYEVIWAICNKFAGKILVINPSHKLSRQYHLQKEETIYVLAGVLTIELGKNGEKKTILKPGQSFHVKPGTIHRFCANEGRVELVEVSTPELKDVVRLEDSYNRIK